MPFAHMFFLFAGTSELGNNHFHLSPQFAYVSDFGHLVNNADWWVGFGFEYLVLVGIWETHSPSPNHQAPNHKLGGS